MDGFGRTTSCTLALEETHLRKLRTPTEARKSPSGVEQPSPPSLPSRAPLLSSPPLLFQSWCKQPCCRELVPVSGQDRAHRLRSADCTAPRLLPPTTPTRTYNSEKENTPHTVDDGFYNLTILPRLVAAGRRDISSRCTDRTDGLVSRHCSAALANDLIPITQRRGRAAGGFRGF